IGAVDQQDAGRINAGEKAHRGSIDECDFAEIEGDATGRFVREELLQPDHVIDVEIATQSEHDGVRCCRAVDSIGQPRVPRADSSARSEPILNGWFYWWRRVPSQIPYEGPRKTANR